MTEVSEPGPIVNFLAKKITTAIGRQNVKEEDLATRISEIEMQTEIAGAGFLKVKLIDPEWTLQTEGWLVVKEELLEPITVEFPEGSGWEWTLVAAEGSTEWQDANLELTFEEKVISELREYWGPKSAPAGTRTRAQFVRDLLVEAASKAEPPFTMVIPSLNVVQPLAPATKA